MATEYYQVQQGKAIPLKEEQLLEHGRVAPDGGEIVVLPGHWLGFFKRRIVIYPGNGPRPFPLAQTQVIQPKSLGVADVKNLFGPYLAGLIRRALHFDLGKFQVKDWVVIGFLGVMLLVCGANSYMLWKIWNYLGL